MIECTKCGTVQEDDGFPLDKQKRGGRRRVCRKCHCEAQKERYRANPQKVKDACRAWRAVNKDRRSATDKKWRLNNKPHAMWLATKGRCSREGVPFNLDISDFEIPSHCPVLGIPLVINRDSSKRPDNAPTIDKVIPDLGYVKGNTRIISNRANRLKQDGSAEEHQLIAEYIERESAGRKAAE